jgi:ABC-type nitrate/sulfonate/bicarbonate transport system substrate-binding protein
MADEKPLGRAERAEYRYFKKQWMRKNKAEHKAAAAKRTPEESKARTERIRRSIEQRRLKALDRKEAGLPPIPRQNTIMKDFRKQQKSQHTPPKKKLKNKPEKEGRNDTTLLIKV